MSFACAADAKETDIAPFLLGLAKVGLLRRQKFREWRSTDLEESDFGKKRMRK